jgi:hypothetical protein
MNEPESCKFSHLKYRERAGKLIERVGNHHLRFLDVRSNAAVRLRIA